MPLPAVVTSPIAEKLVKMKPSTGIPATSIRWLSAVLIPLPWALLVTSAVLGRTTPLTLSLVWLATSIGIVLAIFAWSLLLALLLTKLSDLLGNAAMNRSLIAATPLLLAAPLLLASYLSDEFYHQLVNSPGAQAIILWAPPLFALAAQEAVLVWAIWRRRPSTSWLQRSYSAPLLIFAAFASLYIFTAGGHVYSSDEVSMYEVTQSFGEYLVPATGQNEVASAGEEGLRYSKYGLVPSLLAVPPYLFARFAGWEKDPPSTAFPIPNEIYPLVDLIVGPLSAAATCAVLYLLARELGFGVLPSLITVLAFGMGTSAWPYSKTFFGQAPAAMFLLSAIFFVIKRHSRPYIDYALAGGCLGLAVGTRLELAAIALPFVAIPVAVQVARAPNAGLRQVAVLSIVFLAFAGVTVGWYNYAKTGSILMTRYGDQETVSGFLSSKPYIGIFGTLFSPGFGLFTYNPVTILGILALPLLALRRRMEAYLFGGLLVVAVLFYGSFGDWWAGTSWANRYLVVLLPLAVLPVAVLLERPWRTPMSVLIVTIAIAAGFLVNFLAVLIDFNLGWLDLWDHNAGVHQITWDPHFSPIGAQLRVLKYLFLTGHRVDSYLFFKLGAPSLVAFLLLFVGFATLAVRSALANEAASRTAKQAGVQTVTRDHGAATVVGAGS